MLNSKIWIYPLLYGWYAIISLEIPVDKAWRICPYFWQVFWQSQVIVSDGLKCGKRNSGLRLLFKTISITFSVAHDRTHTKSQVNSNGFFNLKADIEDEDTMNLHIIVKHQCKMPRMKLWVCLEFCCNTKNLARNFIPPLAFAKSGVSWQKFCSKTLVHPTA